MDLIAGLLVDERHASLAWSGGYERCGEQTNLTTPPFGTRSFMVKLISSYMVIK